MTNFRGTSKELRNWISPRREICRLARTWLYTTDMGRMGILRVMEAGSKDIQRYSRPSLAHPFGVEKPVATQGNGRYTWSKDPKYFQLRLRNVRSGASAFKLKVLLLFWWESWSEFKPSHLDHTGPGILSTPFFKFLSLIPRFMYDDPS